MKADTDGPTIIFYTALANLRLLAIHSTPLRSGGHRSTKLSTSTKAE
ncbi:hypothetical protein [Fontibacter flavus]